MCNNGVNTTQLKTMVEMSAEQVALVSSWLKELAHLAGHAGAGVAELESAAQALKAARRSLEDGAEALDGAGGSQVEVHAV
jgi:hypothetical protein